MIKFFRKIRQKLLTQNKFSRYLLYAIGEIILVVIGILIALQVNEWNKERNRKIAEQTIITQLQADLLKSQVGLEQMERFYLKRARACAQVLCAFWKDELPENAHEYEYRLPLSNRIYSPVLGTARSLINSGNLDILNSTKLKNDIISYVEEVDYRLADISRYEVTYYRKGVELVHEAMPNTYRSKEDFNDEVGGYHYRRNINSRPIQKDKVPFRSNLKDIFQDERFFQAYSKLLISHRNTSWRYDEILDSTNELLVKLNEASNTSKKGTGQLNEETHFMSFDVQDLKVLRKIDALLSDSSKWNKATGRNCDTDVVNKRYSLLCAIIKTSEEVDGKWDDDPKSFRPAIRLLLFRIKKYENRRVIDNMIKEWNDHPDTTFEEVKQLLKECIDAVQMQLENIN